MTGKTRARRHVVVEVVDEPRDEPPDDVSMTLILAANFVATGLDAMARAERGEPMVEAAKKAYRRGTARARALRKATRRTE